MHYEIKFLCNNDIYTVTLTLPKEIFEKKSVDEIDLMLSDCIYFEKDHKHLLEYEHSITSMHKTANGIDWIEMI